MADEKITIEINADGNAKAFIKSISDETKKATDTVTSEFKKANSVVNVFLGTLASQAAFQLFRGGLKLVTDSFYKAIDAANVQEKAVNDLNTALALAGDFSADASQGIQAFASEIEKTTTVGDEAVISQVALAKSFGLSNDEATNLVKAAIDLSAATGISLDSAVKNLGKTYSGLTGELGESLPLIRTLTAEQLKAGDAVKLVSDRFAGAASAQTNTFQGSLQQLSNTYGSLLEVVGSLLTENEASVTVIKELNTFIVDLTKSIEANKEEIRKLVKDGILLLGDSLQVIIVGAGIFIRAAELAVNGWGLAVSVISNGIIRLASLFNSDLKYAIESSNEEVLQASEKISELFNQDLAGTALVDGIQLVKEKIEETSRATAAADETVTERLNEQAKKRSTITQKEKTEFEKQLEEELKSIERSNAAKLENKIIFLQRSLELETITAEQRKILQDALDERLQESENKRLELETKRAEDELKKQEAAENELLREVERNELRLKINQASDYEILNSRIKQLKALEQSQKLSSDKQLEVTARRVQAELDLESKRATDTKNVINQLASYQGSKSKEIGTIAKGAAIAQATIKTYEGANSAFSALAGIPIVGPALGAAAAAAAIVAGLQNVSVIAGTPLQTGITEVPQGFPNDTFAARLTTGERVVNAPQNRDLTSFLRDTNGLGKKLDRLIKITEQSNVPIIVNIGGEEIVNVLQSELDGGRTVVL